MARLEVGGDSTLPDTFVQLAAAQRFLRTEPQLPAALTSNDASAVLRSTYDHAVSAFQARLAEFFAARALLRGQ